MSNKSDEIIDAIKKLDAGEIISLVDASGYAYGLCIGDFRGSGRSVKNTWKTGMNWTWVGPGTISMNGKILNPGDQSEEIDMDWS